MQCWSWLTGRKPTASRKYVDLIYNSERSPWAVANPAKHDHPQVGDFDKIDRWTGDFRKAGNIYKDPSILKQIPDLRNPQYEPVPGAIQDEWIITVHAHCEVKGSLGANADAATIASASLEFDVTFDDNTRGACLVMLNVKTTGLPSDVVLLPGFSELSQFRKKKYGLVTSVWSCPTYHLHVSNKGDKKAMLKFAGQAPIPNVPGLSAGGNASVGWESSCASSSSDKGHNKEGKDVYHPLYILERVGEEGMLEQYRGGEQEGTDETWTKFQPPWSPLDDDGLEIRDDE